MAGSERVRFTGRISADDMERMRYWADREGESITEFVECAIHDRIAKLSGDFDAPTLAIQRLNQISDGLLALIELNQGIDREMHEGFASLLGVMRFGDYISVEDEG